MVDSGRNNYIDLFNLRLFFSDATTASKDTLRNGVSLKRQDYKRPSRRERSQAQAAKRKSDSIDAKRAINEGFESYDKCFMRERNLGKIFTFIWMFFVYY